MTMEFSERSTEQICDTDLVDYKELYDELFSRAEQSIGAQLHPVDENKDDGGDAL